MTRGVVGVIGYSLTTVPHPTYNVTLIHRSKGLHRDECSSAAPVAPDPLHDDGWVSAVDLTPPGQEYAQL